MGLSEHVESWSWTTKNISTTTIPMATELNGVVTYNEVLPSTKLHHPSIMWQIKNVRFPLVQNQISSNMVRCWITARGSTLRFAWPFKQKVNRGHVANENHWIFIITVPVLLVLTRLSRVMTSLGAFTHKVTWSCNHLALWGHVIN